MTHDHSHDQDHDHDHDHDPITNGNESTVAMRVPTSRSSAAHPVWVPASFASRHSLRRYDPEVLPRMSSGMPANTRNSRSSRPIRPRNRPRVAKVTGPAILS